MSAGQRQGLLGLLFVSPWLIGFALFKLLPILGSLGVSFTNFHPLHPEETQFIGLANYARIWRDIDAGGSLFGTIGMALTTIPIQMLAALGFAALVNSQRVRGKNLLRALIFMPTIVPFTAIFVVVFGFLDPDVGWLNALILEPLGLPPVSVFSEAGFNFLIMLISVWAIGPGFLIMLGAMHGIPQELYEAARVDGAGPVNRFINITLPMASPAIFFSLIINLVSIFGGMALMDQGTRFGEGISPYDSYVGSVIFRQLDYGYAAGLAWAFFVFMIAAVILLFRTTRYWVHYADEEHGL
jgi:multiple sugar transport system permease protein